MALPAVAVVRLQAGLGRHSRLRPAVRPDRRRRLRHLVGRDAAPDAAAAASPRGCSRRRCARRSRLGAVTTSLQASAPGQRGLPVPRLPRPRRHGHVGVAQADQGAAPAVKAVVPALDCTSAVFPDSLPESRGPPPIGRNPVAGLNDSGTSLGLVVVLFLVLASEFVNGWTDAPNAIATVVSTRVMSPRAAVAMAVDLQLSRCPPHGHGRRQHDRRNRQARPGPASRSPSSARPSSASSSGAWSPGASAFRRARATP